MRAISTLPMSRTVMDALALTVPPTLLAIADEVIRKSRNAKELDGRRPQWVINRPIGHVTVESAYVH